MNCQTAAAAPPATHRSLRKSGLSVLVTSDRAASLAGLRADALVGSVHVETGDVPELARAVARLRPDAVIGAPALCISLAPRIRTGEDDPAVLGIALEGEDIPLLSSPAADICDFITLPRAGGRVAELLCQVKERSRGTHTDRALIVGRRGRSSSTLLHALLTSDPVMAPLHVDGLETARRWMGAVRFDCVILGGGLHDGEADECLHGPPTLNHPVALGVCESADFGLLTRLVRAGCTDVLTAEDLTSPRAAQRRVREALHRERSRRAGPNNRQLLELLEREQAELISAARSDRLTGVPNRAAFNDLLRETHARAREGHAYAVLAFDLDHFKSINDRFGHQRGDEALCAAARAMARALADRGMVARVGGEEFAAVCAGVSLEQARKVAEDIREAVAAASPAGLGLTVSAGVALSCGEAGCTAEQVLAQADTALYRAKAAGRNRVVCQQPEGR